MKLSRRTLIKLGFAAGASAPLGLKHLKLISEADASDKKAAPALTRTTCSEGCPGACGLSAEISEGQISTLIQSADYPEKAYNPRGCARGLSMMGLIYGKDRLKFPLIRTGPRGSGQFRKAEWGEALDYIAENLKKVASKHGPGAIGLSAHAPGAGYVQKGSLVRLAKLNKWSIHHSYDQSGDLPMFWPMTFGVQSEELEPLEWSNSSYTMIFGSNIYQSRPQDSIHLRKAKKGKVVVFDPDYSTTAALSDEWVQIKPDTDTALALGIAKIIIDRKLYDKKFLQTFTDMPFLVRSDNKRRLLASQVPSLLSARIKQWWVLGFQKVFVVNTEKGLKVHNPAKLDDFPADLEGESEVELINGRKVKAKTVFSVLKESLKEYTPEKVEEITGVPRDTIEKIALEASASKPLHLIFGSGATQWYNSDLKGRALSLIPVLTGNIGKSGAGISSYAGQHKYRLNVMDWWFPQAGKLTWVPYLYFLRDEGVRYPAHGVKAMISGWGNPFDANNMADTIRKKAGSGELEFIVSIDTQMNTTSMWSDVVLPSTTCFEQYDITTTSSHPYIQLQQPVIKPMYETKTGFEIARELAGRLNPVNKRFYYPQLDADKASLEVIDRLLKTGGEPTRGITLSDLKKGPVRLRSDAENNRQIPFRRQIKDRYPFPPQTLPYPLAKTGRFVKSGRIEFYKDEEHFLSISEELPVYRESFLETEFKNDKTIDRRYKLKFITRKSLYRGGTSHSNNPVLNEIQGEGPQLLMNTKDAQKRRIQTGDKVIVFNNRGRFPVSVVVVPGLLEGTVVFEEGWWSRYIDRESYAALTETWIKSLHEIFLLPGIWSPVCAKNECMVEVKKAYS